MFPGGSQMRFSPNSRKTIDGGESTTDAGSVNKIMRIGGAAGIQALNYQNVDLFKIPDLI